MNSSVDDMALTMDSRFIGKSIFLKERAHFLQKFKGKSGKGK